MRARHSLPLSRLLGAAGTAVVVAGFVAAVAVGLRGGGEETLAPVRAPAAAARPAPAPPPPAPAVRVVAVGLSGVGALDPEGDGRENDEAAAAATDGDPSTSWRTERYRTFFKQGVGLVLDAGRAVTLVRLQLETETPGFTAQIRAGPSAEGPFTAISREQRTTARTAFVLQPRRARFVLVWITSVPDGQAAHVNEVTARARVAGERAGAS